MSGSAGGWTFLTNHARVLGALVRDPRAPLRQVAANCRITERTARTIVTDLEQAGYLRRRRVGRRNEYVLHLDGPHRHPAGAELPVQALTQILAPRHGRATPPAR